MKRKTKGVVFDLYGTLIHIRNDTKAFVRMFKELGSETIQGTRKAKEIAFTQNFPDLYALARTINPNHSVDIRSYEVEIAAELERAEPFPETLKVLERLRRKGIPTGIISNLPIPYQKPVFDLGLADIIDHLVFSFEVGLKKPDPEVYLLMLKRMGLLPHNTLMIGDNIYCDVQGPKSVGMNAVLLDRNDKSQSADSVNSLESIFQLIS